MKGKNIVHGSGDVSRFKETLQTIKGGNASLQFTNAETKSVQSSNALNMTAADLTS